MKVYLIQPPYTLLSNKYKQAVPPLGLAYIAAVLEKNGHEVKILDAVVEGYETEEKIGDGFIRYGLTFPEIFSRVKSLQPDLIGISCLFSSQWQNTYELGHYLKDKLPNAVIVMGGGHPSVFPKEVIQSGAADYVVIGEGEESIKQLVNYLLHQDSVALNKIDGLAYKDKNGQIRVQPKTKFIENLDELPLPARHLLNMEAYFKINMPQGLVTKHQNNTAIISSRGCPNHCVFCSTSKFWGNRLRLRDPKEVIAEMKQLKEVYGIKELQFLDDNLTLNREHAKQLFQLMIKEGLKLEWTTPQGIAVWTLDREMLELMRRSGCYAITLGIESGSQRVLSEIIHKPLNLNQVTEAVKLAKKVGLYVFSFFVIGLPGETLTDIKKTFKFARELKIDIPVFNFALPLPATELYEICKKNNYLPIDYQHSQTDYYKPQITTQDFNPKQILKLLKNQRLLFILNLLIINPIRFFKVYSMIFKKKFFPNLRVFELFFIKSKFKNN